MIDAEGEQIGILSTAEALQMAAEAELDLVEVSPTAEPPVCRIMDFGKYLYEEKKKKRESRKKQVRVEVKECKFRPKIGDHDFNVRIRRAVKFLSQGNKVKLTVMFRGREHAHPEVAEALIMRAYEALKDLGKMEFHPKKEGRDMHTLIAPLPEAIRKKAMKIRKASESEITEIPDEDIIIIEEEVPVSRRRRSKDDDDDEVTDEDEDYEDDEELDEDEDEDEEIEDDEEPEDDDSSIPAEEST